MTRRIHALTFEVSFFKAEEVKPVTFTINIDRDFYEDPKDAAIDHITAKWDAIKEAVGEGFLPKFKTFKVLGDRQLSDLAWG